MKIIVIEQNRSLLDSLSRYLKEKGHEVSCAFDGVIGVNEFDTSFELVIIDSTVPRVPYLEIIELLKKKKPDIKVFVLYDDMVIKKETLMENKIIDEFFTAPFTAQELEFSLEKVKEKKDEEDLFLTIREKELLKQIEGKEFFPISDLDKKVYRDEQVLEYIEAINSKLNNKKILSEEKGFKLVDKND